MEPWFDLHTASTLGGIIGSCIGIAGGIIGCMCGFCIRKGWKKIVYAAFGLVIAICTILLLAGLTALFCRQPYHIWYSFLLPGLIGTIIFASLLPVVHKRFIQIETRQMQAKDL
jgi:hypothetical protein